MSEKLTSEVVRERRINIMRAKCHATDQCERICRGLEDDLIKLQGCCPHENVKYWPDPGGGKGYYECQACDMRSRSKCGSAAKGGA